MSAYSILVHYVCLRAAVVAAITLLVTTSVAPRLFPNTVGNVRRCCLTLEVGALAGVVAARRLLKAVGTSRCHGFLNDEQRSHGNKERNFYCHIV